MANSNPPTTPPPLKQLAFAFPFRRKTQQGSRGSTADAMNEHDWYVLLKREPSGTFAVTDSGMWHGGIHISEAGAGQALDFKGGVRCIADGEVVAWRLNRAYPVSSIPARNGHAAISVPYSTGFVLVKHVMEFPRGSRLVFFSLYMHLQDYAGYESDPSLPWPAYWAAKLEVTQDAVDKPKPGAGGQTAPDGQTGLNVHASKPHGTVLGILPRGTQVSLSTREGVWGQIANDPGALYARTAGAYVNSGVAKGKWIFLGKEPGHNGPVVKNVMPDSSFDCVNVVPEEKRVKVKAGDVLGYPGRYDSLRDATSTRMVHIEVFCDESVKQFIDVGRTWVNANGANSNQWTQLGLPADPAILRIDKGTTLYHEHGQPGSDAKKTDVVQVYGFATLPQDAAHLFTETTAGTDGQKRRWWNIDSADVQRNAITGWVREQSFAGGRVTREFSQSWVDFECHDEDHDPTHTIFASTNDYVNYATGRGAPDLGSVSKLSALMSALYRALYPNEDGVDAVGRLRGAAQNPPESAFPWVGFRTSRLIPKHESEWANPAKWQDLVSAIEEHSGPQPEHEEEKKRIAKLVWWDEVKAGVQAFPDPHAFHIHPVALVGNFRKLDSCNCGCCLEKQFKVTRWKVHYGPIYKGNLSLENSPAMRRFLDSGRMTEREHRILAAMSQNEGNVDGVQAYDSEILTAGACQKTITRTGDGEFPIQVAQFKSDNEAAYRRLFEQCGWTVETSSVTKMYYQDSEITGGVKVTGDQLHAKMREGCSQATFGQNIRKKPLAVIAHAIADDEFQDKQVKDFVDRLRLVNTLTPVGYTHSISEYFLTDLGRATALDHHVNRPGNVVKDVGKALDVFFHAHSTVQRDPSTWGDSHAAYESEILSYYGEHRHMNDCHPRFAHLKSRLS